MKRVSFLPAQHLGNLDVADELSCDGALSEICTAMGKPYCTLTISGRSALAAILTSIGLSREDEVWITTSHGFPNISSCVTCTVFNVCKPSRVLTEQTRAIIVIHEFGVPHPDTPKLRVLADHRGIPLLEDCAHTIDSRTDEWRVGGLGDFVIVSLPKLFPCESGGMLLGSKISYSTTWWEQNEIQKTVRVFARYWPTWSQQASRRREIYGDLTERFKAIGLDPLFAITEQITPWFFPVPTCNWHEMIEVAHLQGVDCGRWHGTDMVVFPCHQFLTTGDVVRIFNVAATIQNNQYAKKVN